MAGTFDRVLRFFQSPKIGTTENVEQFVSDAKTFLDKYRRNIEEVARQRQLLELMAHALGGLVWIKRWDADQSTYLYEFANHTHCQLFFRFDEECLPDCTTHVQGRSDVDLLNDFRERTRLQHTYGELCISTDVHATEQAILHYESMGERGSMSCRYLECGYIGDKALVLEVVKTPLFNPEYPCKCWASHTYTVGNALDVTLCCESRLEFANQCIERGQAKRLQPGVFWLFPEHEACNLLEQELPRE